MRHIGVQTLAILFSRLIKVLFIVEIVNYVFGQKC